MTYKEIKNWIDRMTPEQLEEPGVVLVTDFDSEDYYLILNVNNESNQPFFII